MKEVWKSVEGYEGIYEVSNIGNVKSLDREVLVNNPNGSNWVRYYKSKQLSTKLTRNGYVQVELNKYNKGKLHLVHRLVAKAFLDNPEDLPDVNHKSGNKQDNSVINLNWCSKSQNMKHRVEELGIGLGEDNGNSKLTLDNVKEIRKLYEETKVTQKELSEIFKVGKSTIGYIVNYKTWKEL